MGTICPFGVIFPLKRNDLGARKGHIRARKGQMVNSGFQDPTTPQLASLHGLPPNWARKCYKTGEKTPTPPSPKFPANTLPAPRTPRPLSRQKTPPPQPPPVVGFSIETHPPIPSWNLGLPLPLPRAEKIKNLRNVHQDKRRYPLEVSSLQLSFFAYSCVWEFFAYNLNFLTYKLELLHLQLSFIAYNGKVWLRNTSTDCSKEAQL